MAEAQPLLLWPFRDLHSWVLGPFRNANSLSLSLSLSLINHFAQLFRLSAASPFPPPCPSGSSPLTAEAKLKIRQRRRERQEEKVVQHLRASSVAQRESAVPDTPMLGKEPRESRLSSEVFVLLPSQWLSLNPMCRLLPEGGLTALAWRPSMRCRGLSRRRPAVINSGLCAATPGLVKL